MRQNIFQTTRIRAALLAGTALLLMGAAAAAQTVLPAPNALGLYFDGEAESNVAIVANPGQIQGFLLFRDPTVAEITGWEVKITCGAGTSVTGVELPVGATAGLSGPEEWSATLAQPLPGSVLTKLAVFTFQTDGTPETLIYLGNVANPSAPGDFPGVRLGDGTWASLPVTTGDPNSAVAGINATTATETPTWGDLKALFR